MRLLRASAAVVLAASAGCSGTAPKLPDFADVTRVVVTGTGGKEVATILNADDIGAIVRFANARNDRWVTPWAGVPVPSFGATLYAGERCAGSFGAGPGFFATNRAGGFHSRDAGAEEVAEFARLLGMPELKPR